MELVEEIKKALEFTKQREYKKAEKIYKDLLKKDPENESVLSFLGLLYFNCFQYEKAEKYLDKAYKISHSDKLVSYLGVSKYCVQKYREALPYLEKAVNLNGTQELYRTLLVLYLILGENSKICYQKAYEYGIKAIKLFPFDKIILSKLMEASLRIGKFKESEEYTRKILKLEPASPDALSNLALLYEVLYSDEKKARECYRKILKYGNKEAAYLNLAISYSKTSSGNKKAYYYIQKLRRLKSNIHGLVFLQAKYYLSQRKFMGYKYYVKFGSDTDNIYTLKWLTKFKNPWKGEKDCKDKVLFLFGDQGIGDQLMFIRYLPFLAKRFKQVKLMAEKSILTLFKRSFKDLKNIKYYPISDTFPMYDKSVFLANTPYYLKKRFNEIPFSQGYLKADEGKIKEYKSKYFNTDKLKMGICWEAGGVGLKEAIHRSVNIELFEKIIKNDKAEIYSLQVNPSLDNYKKYDNLTDLGVTFKDFDDTAAALMNLDVFVTVDTSVANLAGALGVKTFLILPYCTDWRWFDNTETTEWYDSVRIFKQDENEAWDKVFERLYDSVCALT